MDDRDEYSSIERWTPDQAMWRDVTTDPDAHDRVEATHAAFADDLRRLGFEPLAIHDCTFVEPLEWIEDEDCDEILNSDEGGEVRDTVREEFARSKALIEEMNASGSLCWVWHHPDTGDTASLEHNELGDWLTFSRRLEDGRILRTMRAPERMDRGNGSALGPLANTRVPLLFRWFERLVGQHWRVGVAVLPHIGQIEHRLADVSADDAWTAHQALVAQHGGGSDVVRPTSAGVLATARRTIHVTFARTEVGVWPAMWQGWILRLSAWGLSIAIVGVASPGNVGALLFAGLVLPYLSRTVWSWACGVVGHAVTVLWVVGAIAAVAWRGWNPWAFAAAACVSLWGVAAVRSLWLWRTRAHLPLNDRSVVFPPPVPAAEFERRYRA